MHEVSGARRVTLRLVSGGGHYEAVVESVLAARCSVWIATANLKELMVRAAGAAPAGRAPYVSVLDLLDEQAGAGVELRVLHGALPSKPFCDAFDRHPRLVRGGVQLRLCPRVHMKVVIVDGELLYLGSANWTGAGLGAKSPRRRNFELGVISDDALLLDEVQAIYDRIWRGDECTSCGRPCDDPLDRA